MRSARFKASLITGAAALVGLALVAPTAGAAAAAAAAKSAPKSAPAVKPGPSQVMIVILKQQQSGVGSYSSRALVAGSEQAPLISQLRSAGAAVIATTSVLNTVIAKMSAAEAKTLRSNPSVEMVIPNYVIPGPTLPSLEAAAAEGPDASTTKSGAVSKPAQASPPACGTEADPELDPEALSVINGLKGLSNIDGAGVKVAYMADGIDTTDADFQRNSAYASADSSTGSPVITQYDFSSDGLDAPTPGGEAFGDASSIVAQARTSYDLNSFVNADAPDGGNCYIKILGDAPGVTLLALKVFAENNDTTLSGFLQAINFAVAQHVQVLNESFGSNGVPDLALDVNRMANDAAVRDGVTVVASSGDAGVNSTQGSPSTDPLIISAGASTTYRLYGQWNYGGISLSNGRWLDNNVSNLSSGGFNQAGGTVDLVAPGELNWALCAPLADNPDFADYTDCTSYAATNSDGEPTQAAPIEAFGGTSESSPLTAGAAADVIEAYASTHSGSDPTPAQVKQIILSTTTDIDAPGTEQGAGLLNIYAAEQLAESMHGTTSAGSGGLLVSPNQVNVVGDSGASSTHKLTFTNTGSSSSTVKLSTREIGKRIGSDSGSFCMNPAQTASPSCPLNTGTLQIFTGVTDEYQSVPFTVAANSHPSRLSFAADYEFTGQSSVLHIALLEPDGTYAAYSEPQGLADFADIEVANPVAGTWHAIFYTVVTGAEGTGTSGTIQWDASTYEYQPGGTVSPSTLTIGAGDTASATLTTVDPTAAGDIGQSVVVHSTATPNAETTIPVTIRTLIALTSKGGNFSGVLTGGNGRADAYAQSNTYEFNVPAGERDLDLGLHFTEAIDDASIFPLPQLNAYLLDPSGDIIGYTSNYSADAGNPLPTNYAQIYAQAPQAGKWSLVLAWANPVAGNSLTEPFTGTIGFNQVSVTSALPDLSYLPLQNGESYDFEVNVRDTGNSQEAYFLDPRLDSTEKIALPEQNDNLTDDDLTLPLTSADGEGEYFVPAKTTHLFADISSASATPAPAPVTFDLSAFPGDPDLSPAISSPQSKGTQGTDSASVVFSAPEASPGFWAFNPALVGPYPTTGATSISGVSMSLSAVTQTFDQTINTESGDLWLAFNGDGDFDPNVVSPGETDEIGLTITPDGTPGQVVKGTMYVEDYALGSSYGGYAAAIYPDGQVLAAIPYEYVIAN